MTERTGWPPGLLQDDDRKLSKALSQTPHARLNAKEAADDIGRTLGASAGPDGAAVSRSMAPLLLAPGQGTSSGEAGRVGGSAGTADRGGEKPHLVFDDFCGRWVCSSPRTEFGSYRIGYGRDHVEAYDDWKGQPV